MTSPLVKITLFSVTLVIMMIFFITPLHAKVLPQKAPQKHVLQSQGKAHPPSWLKKPASLPSVRLPRIDLEDDLIGKPSSSVLSLKNSLPGLAILPAIIPTRGSKAFQDLPALVAASSYKTLRDKLQGFYETHLMIVNPEWSLNQIERLGALPLYQKVSEQVIQTGAPLDKDLLALADKLSNASQHIEWLLFCLSELDMNHIQKPHGLLKTVRNKLYDIYAFEPTYHISSQLLLFSVKPQSPLIWQHQGSSAIELSDFNTFSPNIYDNSLSAWQFKASVSRMVETQLDSFQVEKLGYTLSTNAILKNTPDEDTLPVMTLPKHHSLFNPQK
jgi:hypothetical protein